MIKMRDEEIGSDERKAPSLYAEIDNHTKTHMHAQGNVYKYACQGTYLTLMGDGGVEAIMTIVAGEVECRVLKVFRQLAVERVVAQVVADDFMGQVRVVLIVDLWVACERWLRLRLWFLLFFSATLGSGSCGRFLGRCQDRRS